MSNVKITTPAGIMIYPHLWEPNVPIKLPDGRTVGSGKYECQIVLDPATDDFHAFAAAVGRDIGASLEAANRLIRESFPAVGDRFTCFDPDHLILRAKTKFGPVPVFDRKGKQVLQENVYSGNVVRALVRPFVFTSAFTGKKAVALRLQAVLIVAPGNPISPKGGALSARALFGDLIEDNGEEEPPF